MNWTLVRFLGLWTVAVAVALTPLRVPSSPERPDAWVDEYPLRTAGCPALQQQLDAWQREMSLTYWSIDAACEKSSAEQDYLGLSRSHPKSRKAEILIRDGLSRGWQQFVLLHELAHVGVAAGHWWVPEGRDEEDYMDAIAFNFYDRHARDVRSRMLESARHRLRQTETSTAAPEARAGSATTASLQAPGQR